MKLEILTQNCRAILIYDNMNFKKIIKDEVLDHSDFMIAITIIAIIIFLKLFLLNLKQHMHNSNWSLNKKNIFETFNINENDHDFEKQIIIFLIFNAVQEIHSMMMNNIFNNFTQNFSSSQIFVIKRFLAHSTRFQQLEVIMKNEKTLFDTIWMYENIFLNQLDSFSNDEIFARCLFSIYENILFIKLAHFMKLK